jgi:hypothetical protein
MFTLSMEELVTVGVIAALFVGVHLAFAVYLYRALSDRRQGTPTPDGLESGAETPPMGDNDLSSNAHDDDRQTVPCPACGVPNDPSFRYCRRCITNLSEHSTPRDSVQPSSG